jgi:transcription regulator MmyB-like protein
VIAGHEPYPALAVDRHWTLVTANAAVPVLLAGVAPRLLEPPVNVLRLGMHPEGLAPRIVNYVQWREHTLTRLRQQIAATADPILIEMLAELESYPQITTSSESPSTADATDYGGVVVPFNLRSEHGVLSFFSTTTVFGTPLDITLAELAIESFFPADPQTADALTRIARLPGAPA